MRSNVAGGIRVVGLTSDGRRVDAGPLTHGAHPERLLARHGWTAESPCAAKLATDGALELAYTVTELSGIPLALVKARTAAPSGDRRTTRLNVASRSRTTAPESDSSTSTAGAARTRTSLTGSSR